MAEAFFELYKLKITIEHTQEKDGRKPYSRQPAGTSFYVSGENLIFPEGDHSFPLYALSAILPLLPAKQRFKRSDVTAVSLK